MLTVKYVLKPPILTHASAKILKSLNEILFTDRTPYDIQTKINFLCDILRTMLLMLTTLY